MCTSYGKVLVESMELRRRLFGGDSSILQKVSKTSDDAKSPAYLVPAHDLIFLAPCCLRTSSASVHTCRRAELPVVQSLLYTSRCVFRPPARIRFRWTHFGRRSHSLTALYRTFIFLGDFWYKSSESCSWRKVCVTVDVWFVSGESDEDEWLDEEELSDLSESRVRRENHPLPPLTLF